MESAPRIPLSIVLAATEPWPAVQPQLDRLCAQGEPISAEIIVGDSTGRGLPQRLEGTRNRNVRSVTVLKASVFELRARAVEQARGDVIAVTEDHCLVEPDWCERILEAHGRHPEAELIVGGVVNGSPHCRLDWANFFLTFAAFLPPIEWERIERVPTAANVSFKRRVLSAGAMKTGDLEFTLIPRLCVEKKAVYDDRILVAHVQSNSLWRTCLAHYHNGRTTSGLPLDGMSATARRAEWRRCWRLPREIVRTCVDPMQNKPAMQRTFRQSLPFLQLLACCHTLGRLAALMLGGAGNSPRYLH